MMVFCFDTETTGLTENLVIKDDKLPEVIEFYGCAVDLASGEVHNEVHHLIKPRRGIPSEPPDKRTKKTISEITGITNETLADKPLFPIVAPSIISALESAPVVVAHNCSYDVEMINIETRRMNYIMRWPRTLCTVEQTIHLTGRRLSLGALHTFLFGAKHEDAHRAKPDVEALVRCCVELHKRGEL